MREGHSFKIGSDGIPQSSCFGIAVFECGSGKRFHDAVNYIATHSKTATVLLNFQNISCFQPEITLAGGVWERAEVIPRRRMMSRIAYVKITT
jgi:hypothetical protein